MKCYMNLKEKMTEKECKIQKALGLFCPWDVYLKYTGEAYYTIFEIEAVSKNHAIAEIKNRAKKCGRNLQRMQNGDEVIFALKK